MNSLTCQRYADKYGYRLGALDKAPGSSKVSGTHTFVRVHFQRVIVAAAEDAINPHEQQVSLMAALNGGQREDRQGAHENGRLTKVLAANSAFGSVMHDDGAEGKAADGPRQAHVHLQRQH